MCVWYKNWFLYVKVTQAIDRNIKNFAKPKKHDGRTVVLQIPCYRRLEVLRCKKIRFIVSWCSHLAGLNRRPQPY